MGNSVKVDELEGLVVVECKIEKEINTHGKAVIKGYLQNDFNNQVKRALDTGEYFTIRALDAEEQNRVVFSGILSVYDIRHMKDFEEIYIEFEAATKRMDKLKCKRSFSNENECYENVINYINNYTNIYTNTSEAVGKMGKISMQYLETDWEYLKRLAAEKNSCIVPEYEYPGGGFCIGIPDGPTISVENVEHENIVDFFQYMKKKKNNVDTSLANENVYVFTSRKILSIGTRVKVVNGELVIYRSLSKMNGANLVTTYYAKLKEGLKTIPYKNLNIIGASITGRVKEVQGDKLKVTMLLDGLQDNPKAMEFATVYSSTGEAGWYCMPELGDIVRVYFPNENEDEAFVFNAMQVDKAGKKPQIKFFRNPQGKEIEFGESYIKITNNAGLTIILDDVEGIKIETKNNTDINVIANKDIIMKSETGMLKITAEESVSLNKDESSVVLDDDVRLSGKQIHVKEIG